jgi:hypothetical protein
MTVSTDALKLRIMQALTTLIEGCNPENVNARTGAVFDYDLRGKVFRGKMDFGQETALRFVTMIEPPMQGDGPGANFFDQDRNDPWRLLVHGFTKNSTPHTTDDAYNFSEDVRLRIGRALAMKGPSPMFQDDYLLGRTASALVVHQTVVRGPVQNVSATAFFYLPLSISLHENPF